MAFFHDIGTVQNVYPHKLLTGPVLLCFPKKQRNKGNRHYPSSLFRALTVDFPSLVYGLTKHDCCDCGAVLIGVTSPSCIFRKLNFKLAFCAMLTLFSNLLKYAYFTIFLLSASLTVRFPKIHIPPSSTSCLACEQLSSYRCL